jgi:hypothetical protein
MLQRRRVSGRALAKRLQCSRCLCLYGCMVCKFRRWFACSARAGSTRTTRTKRTASTTNTVCMPRTAEGLAPTLASIGRYRAIVLPRRPVHGRAGGRRAGVVSTEALTLCALHGCRRGQRGRLHGRRIPGRRG